jgi:hypothetical protein
MLDVPLQSLVSERSWASFSHTAELPCDPYEFFSAELRPGRYESRRSHDRVLLRGRAKITHMQEELGVFTADFSPKGMGFFSPVQLFPLERIVISWDGSRPLDVIVKRCRRVKQNCYSIGVDFVDGPLGPAACRDLIRDLQRSEDD